MILANAYAPDLRVQREAKTLAAAGWDVTVLAWDRRAEMLRRTYDGQVMIERITTPGTFGTFSHGLFRRFFFWQRAASFLVHTKPDVIHAHDVETIPIAIWARFLGVPAPVVLDLHETYSVYIESRYGKLIGLIVRLFELVAITWANALITVSERQKRWYRRQDVDSIVLPNWPDIGDDPVEPVRAERFGLNPSKPTVAYIGMIDRDRPLKTLEEIAQSGAAQVLVAGAGPEQEIVEDAARRIAGYHFVGYVDPSEVRSVFAACDFVLYGSSDDVNRDFVLNATSNTVPLALSVGTPVMIVGVHGDTAIVENEGAGLVVPNERADAVGALRGALSSPERMSELREAAEYASKKYRWSKVSHRIIRLYEQLPR
jgi:glycosyltransferase involved in cell wall biosynthesis